MCPAGPPASSCDAARAGRAPGARKDAPRGRRGPLTPPQAGGRDRWPAVWLHGHGVAPGSVTAILCQRH
jgi:hypothetical protein